MHVLCTYGSLRASISCTQGLEFARYSLDYHTLRNYLYTVRTFGKQAAGLRAPSYAKKIVEMYNTDGEIDELAAKRVTPRSS